MNSAKNNNPVSKQKRGLNCAIYHYQPLFPAADLPALLLAAKDRLPYERNGGVSPGDNNTSRRRIGIPF